MSRLADTAWPVPTQLRVEWSLPAAVVLGFLLLIAGIARLRRPVGPPSR